MWRIKGAWDWGGVILYWVVRKALPNEQDLSGDLKGINKKASLAASWEKAF